MIFTDYSKVLVLIFSGMRNTTFFLAKKLLESYLLITEKFLFWSFQEWEIRSFLSQKLIERWYLLAAEKFLFWTFRWWEIRPFFQLKSWWKDDIYLAFLSFPWYSRTWVIWFFARCLVSSLLFEIILVDRLHHFVKFWTVSSNSVASPMPQNWKIMHLNCREVRFKSDLSKKSYLNF